MATVTYYLNTGKLDKHGKAPIYLQYYHKQERCRYFTGEKIAAQYWSNSKTRYIKPSYSEDTGLESYLQNLKRTVESIIIKAREENKAITPAYIKSQLQNKSNDDPDILFFPLFERFIEIQKLLKAPSTIKNYRNSLQYLYDFQKHTSFQFQFEEINDVFYSEYLNYQISVKNLTNNTIGRNIKVLKTFLTWSLENGYHKNLEFKKFKVLREEVDNIYLTSDELDRLYSAELVEISKERARDLFCFGCFTGLRFSDITQLTKNDIQNGQLKIRIQKTKDILTVPLLQQAKYILEKYNYVLPTISNQKLNKHLKDLGKLAEIDDETPILKYRGSKVEKTTLPKYNLITTHTARRTFITLSLEKGVRPEVVMAITGHKTYQRFKPYIKLVDSVKKDELLKAWI